MEIKTCEEYVLMHLENALNELDNKEERITELMQERNKALRDLATLGDKYDALCKELYEVYTQHNAIYNENDFKYLGGFFASKSTKLWEAINDWSKILSKEIEEPKVDDPNFTSR